MSSSLEMSQFVPPVFLSMLLIQMSHDQPQSLVFSFQSLGRLPNSLRTIVRKMSEFEVTSKTSTKALEGVQDARVIN